MIAERRVVLVNLFVHFIYPLLQLLRFQHQAQLALFQPAQYWVLVFVILADFQLLPGECLRVVQYVHHRLPSLREVHVALFLTQ